MTVVEARSPVERWASSALLAAPISLGVGSIHSVYRHAMHPTSVFRHAWLSYGVPLALATLATERFLIDDLDRSTVALSGGIPLGLGMAVGGVAALRWARKPNLMASAMVTEAQGAYSRGQWIARAGAGFGAPLAGAAGIVTLPQALARRR